MKPFPLLLILAVSCSAALTPAPPPPPKKELDRVWADYQSRFAAKIAPQLDNYLRELKKLEDQAMERKDAMTAAPIRKERTSRDPGVALLAIPDGPTAPEIGDLKRLRAEFENAREDVAQELNTWCAAELEPLEKMYMDRDDPISAAAIHTEIQALSKPPLRILHASYGAGKMANVTVPLRKAIRFNRVQAGAVRKLFGDPVPHQRKNGSVTFRLGDGEAKTISFGEGSIIRLP